MAKENLTSFGCMNRNVIIAGDEHEFKYRGVGAAAIPYRPKKLGFSRD